MRLLSALVILALGVNCAAEAAVSVPADATPSSAYRAARAAGIAGCEDTVVQPTPLEPRARIIPIGYSPAKARPARPKHKRVHRAAPKRHVVKRVVKKKPPVRHVVKRKRTVAARPIAHRPRPVASRPVLHRVTYAAPLCGERTQQINDLLGLDQPIIAAAVPIGPVQNVNFDLPPVTGTTTVPGLPVGGGVDIFPGIPNTPIGPPVLPPAPVPEPATWAMIILGMAATGIALRRRRTRDRKLA